MQRQAALPSDAAQLKAIANWLKIITSRADNDEDEILTNGSALFQVLGAIYLQTFDSIVSTPCLTISYEDVLHIELSIPPLDLNGRKPAEDQLACLHRLILIAIAKSEANEAQIGAMQSLPYEQQMILMQVIESGLSDPNPSKAEENELKNNDSFSHSENNAETLQRELAKQKELTILHQDQLTHAVEQLERVTQENKQMAEEVCVGKCLTKLPHLRDCEHKYKALLLQVEDWRPIVDLSKRQEAQLDEYHERLDEVAELQQEVKKLRAERSKSEKENETFVCDRDGPHDGTTLESLQREYAKLQQEYKRVELVKNELLERLAPLEGGEENFQTKFDLGEDDKKSSSSHPEMLVSLRDEIARLQSQLESTGLDSASEHDSTVRHDPAASRESHLAAIHAEITAMRNNARSKEKEAKLQLRKLSKKYSSDKNASTKNSEKSVSKDFRPILDLLNQSFKTDDLVMKRLAECWDAASQNVHTPLSSTSNSDETERECDALRRELRLMSSAYHTLGQHVYRETSWNQLVAPHTEDPIAKSDKLMSDTPSPVSPASNLSWLAQQRDNLAGALRFARK